MSVANKVQKQVCMDIILLQHHALSYITIPTYVAAVGIAATQVCSYLCRDNYLGQCMML